MADYCRIANATVAGNDDEVIRLAYKMEILHDASADAERAFLDFGSIIRKPFLQDVYTCGVEDDQLMEDVKVVGKNMILHSEIRSPRDIIFLHRALTGIYSMLCRLEHRGEYEKIRSRYAQEVLDVVDGTREDRGWK